VGRPDTDELQEAIDRVVELGEKLERQAKIAEAVALVRRIRLQQIPGDAGRLPEGKLLQGDRPARGPDPGTGANE
jgi:hypothetical protein